MKRRHKLFLGFFALGFAFMMADEAWRWKNREKFDYLDVEIWAEKGYLSVSFKGKERDQVKRLVEELAKSGKVVWFGAPQLSNCILEIWDAWEEEFYRVCRGENRKWYVQLPGSSGGRSTERYFEVEEKEVLEMMEKLRELL